MKHEGDRAPGKYDAILKAKELAGYTIRVTSNEKNFPKRYRLSVVNKLQNKAMDILDLLMMAKEIMPTTKIEYEQRQLYLHEARAAVYSLCTMMEVAANTFYMDMGKLAFWTELTDKLCYDINLWIERDKKNFNYFIKE